MEFFQHAGVEAQRALDGINEKLATALGELNADKSEVHSVTREVDRRTEFITRLVDDQTKVNHRFSSLFERNILKTENVCVLSKDTTEF